MISVSEAKQHVTENTQVLEAIRLNLYRATGLILAEDIYAETDVPPFDQSAMDGYAYRFSDWKEGQGLQLAGEMAAGDVAAHTFLPHTALRIFTGAEVPSYFDTVVMQEKTTVQNDEVFIQDPLHKKGMNIRLKSSQTKKGSLALKAGARISAATAGYLAGLGKADVKVIPTPRVSIITTGNELNAPGTVLEAGKVFECNSYSLNAALSQLNIQPIRIVKTKDKESDIVAAISTSLYDSDLILLSGGISVGEYDFVKQALQHCGVNPIFHKVKQKPGKPLYFGKKNNTLVFAMPGNPAALLTCFYEYIFPAIQIMMGQNGAGSLQLPLSAPYSKKPGLTHFLKAKRVGDEVCPLSNQESYLMNSFAEADCLIQLEEDRSDYIKGELVEVHVLS